MAIAIGEITDEAIEELRKRIGSFYRAAPAVVKVHEDNIRIFADGIGDINPLFRDPEYGRTSPYRSIIAPAGFFDIFLHHTATAVGGLPGIHAFHSGSDWELYRPIRPGDFITVTYRPDRIEEKAGRFAGRMVVVDAECLYRNQRGEVVARAHGYVFRVSRREGRDRGKYSDVQKVPYTTEQLQAIWDAYDREQRRGPVPRYWEDVQIGDELPPLVKGPLRTVEIAFIGEGPHPQIGAGASVGGAHYYQLAEYRKRAGYAERDPVTGIEDHPHRGHWEAAMAASMGVPGIYDAATQRCAWLAQALGNWAGDHGWLKRLACEYRLFNVVGDTTWIRGKVLSKWIRGSEYLVQLEIYAENQRGQVTTPGWAIVALPSRHGRANLPYE